MKYRVETTERFNKEFKKLDKYTATLIKAWIDKYLVNYENPKIDTKIGKWRYRIGDYRLICCIEDEKLIILALAIGHRREIYN